jgi:hypothetical protein
MNLGNDVNFLINHQPARRNKPPLLVILVHLPRNATSIIIRIRMPIVVNLCRSSRPCSASETLRLSIFIHLRSSSRPVGSITLSRVFILLGRDGCRTESASAGKVIRTSSSRCIAIVCVGNSIRLMFGGYGWSVFGTRSARSWVRTGRERNWNQNDFLNLKRTLPLWSTCVVLGLPSCSNDLDGPPPP